MYKYNYRPGYGSTDLLIEIYSGPEEKDFFNHLLAALRTLNVQIENINDLWMTYRLYIERFYDYIKLNRELQDLDQKKNLEMKMQLCEQAEELMLEPSLNKAIQSANQLQNKWKDIGVLPRDKRTEVWARFKAAVDKEP